jgi:hypothetical protein
MESAGGAHAIDPGGDGRVAVLRGLGATEPGGAAEGHR